MADSIKISQLKVNNTFEYELVFGFEYLTEKLEEKIMEMLKKNNYYNLSFDVVSVKGFSIKEMLVVNNTVVCKVLIEAESNIPEVGKIVKIDEFEIKENNIIFKSGRIQIVAKLVGNKKPSYNIRIEAFKNISKNIICIGTLV